MDHCEETRPGTDLSQTITENVYESFESSTHSRSSGQRKSRKERSQQRRLQLQKEQSTSPHVSSFVQDKTAASDGANSCGPNRSAKLMKNQFGKTKGAIVTTLHERQTVSSMHKNRSQAKCPSASAAVMASYQSNPMQSVVTDKKRRSLGSRKSSHGSMTNLITRSKEKHL